MKLATMGLLMLASTLVLTGCLSEETDDLMNSKPVTVVPEREISAAEGRFAFFWDYAPDRNQATYSNLIRNENLQLNPGQTQTLPLQLLQYQEGRWEQDDTINSWEVSLSSFCASNNQAELRKQASSQAGIFTVDYAPQPQCTQDIVTARYNKDGAFKAVSYYVIESVWNEQVSASGLSVSLEPLPATPIPVGESLRLSASIRNAQGNLYQDALDVNLTSRCLESQNATLSLQQAFISTGQLDFTYTPLAGCSGQDTLILRARNLDDEGVQGVFSLPVLFDPALLSYSLNLEPPHQGSLTQEQEQALTLALKQGNEFFTDNAEVQLSSSCSDSGLATFSPAFSTLSTGRLTSLYTASAGCSSDTLIARALVDGEVVATETLQVTLRSPTQPRFTLALSGSSSVVQGQELPLALALKQDDEFFTDNAEVQLSSSCSDSGLATFSPASSTLSTGRLTSLYTASAGCSSDTLIARAFIDGEQVASDLLEISLSAPPTPPGPVVRRLDFSLVNQDLSLNSWPVHSQAYFQAQLSPMPGGGKTVRFTFGSDCALQDNAQWTAAELASFSGRVEVGYRPSFNCTSDTLVAKAFVDEEQVASQSVQVETTPAETYSVSFDGFNPAVGEGQMPRLRRKGVNSSALLAENRTLTFTVRDVSGVPVGAGQRIDFEILLNEALDSEDLDIDEVDYSNLTEAQSKQVPILLEENAVTDASGQVQVSIESGTASLVFNVRATLVNADGDEPDPSIFALSPSIFVSSGLPSEEHFNVLWLTEELDGESNFHELEFMATVGDEHGYPVPDGTVVHFRDASEMASPSFSLPVMQSTCEVGLGSEGAQERLGSCRVQWYGRLSERTGHTIGIEAWSSGLDAQVNGSWYGTPRIEYELDDEGEIINSYWIFN